MAGNFVADVRFALERELLNRPGGKLIYSIQVRSVINHSRVINRDIGHVDRVVNNGDVTAGLDEPAAQDGFADVANIDEVIIERPDTKAHVDVAGNGAAFIHDPAFLRRYRRPTDVV